MSQKKTEEKTDKVEEKVDVDTAQAGFSIFQSCT